MPADSAPPRAAPQPVAHQATETVDVLVIGTGFAGLGMAIKLKEAGRHDFVVLEKAQGVGGTWRDNTYPGCACDVQSALYSFSFEQNPDWTRMFPTQPEIRAYLEKVAGKYGLVPHLRFGAEVTGVRYDDSRRRWMVATADGRRFDARVVVSGMGGLSIPMIPAIPGADTFKGPAFHSAQWDHGVDLTGKNVAVIGSGASAIQFVPAIAGQVKRLAYFQRTPSWVLPKPDAALPASVRALFKHLPLAQEALRQGIYWFLETRVLGFVINPKVMKLVQREAVAHIGKYIKDPALRARVTPDYTIGCKRVLVSNNYYPALARENVEVITDGVQEITAEGVVDAKGVLHPADVILYGTGFKAQDPVPRGAIFGRHGQDLLDAWKNGPEAYLGTSVAGFPNLFFIVGPNTGLGHSSMVYMIESQITYIVDALKTMDLAAADTAEVRPEVQQKFNAEIQQKLGGSIWASGCKSWYINASGRNTTLWPGFTWRFRQMTKRFKPTEYQLTERARRAA